MSYIKPYLSVEIGVKVGNALTATDSANSREASDAIYAYEHGKIITIGSNFVTPQGVSYIKKTIVTQVASKIDAFCGGEGESEMVLVWDTGYADETPAWIQEDDYYYVELYNLDAFVPYDGMALKFTFDDGSEYDVTFAPRNKNSYIGKLEDLGLSIEIYVVENTTYMIRIWTDSGASEPTAIVTKVERQL